MQSGSKLICAALSLPIPPESCNGEVEKDADKVCSEGLDQKADNKLLLVGCDQSGTSAIFKQVFHTWKCSFLLLFDDDKIIKVVCYV